MGAGGDGVAATGCGVMDVVEVGRRPASAVMPLIVAVGAAPEAGDVAVAGEGVDGFGVDGFGVALAPPAGAATGAGGEVAAGGVEVGGGTDSGDGAGVGTDTGGEGEEGTVGAGTVGTVGGGVGDGATSGDGDGGAAGVASTGVSVDGAGVAVDVEDCATVDEGAG